MINFFESQIESAKRILKKDEEQIEELKSINESINKLEDVYKLAAFIDFKNNAWSTKISSWLDSENYDKPSHKRFVDNATELLKMVDYDTAIKIVGLGTVK